VIELATEVFTAVATLVPLFTAVVIDESTAAVTAVVTAVFTFAPAVTAAVTD